MMATAAAGNAGAVVSSFTPWDVVSSALTGTTLQAYLSFSSTGAVAYSTTPSGPTTVGSPAWWAPIAPAPQQGYWIKATLTAGTTPNLGSGVGTWLDLYSALRYWGFNSGTSGILTCTLTIQIALDAAGASIIFTSAGNKVSANHV